MIKRLTIAGIDLYRAYISPIMPQTCRFHPSCSKYAREAINQYGLISGSWKVCWRLLRCHPWHPGGYDPVK